MVRALAIAAEGFGRRAKAEALLGSVDEPLLQATNVGMGKGVQVAGLGNFEPENADAVLGGALLPTVIGRTEVGTCSEASIDLEMVAVLIAVVVSERAAEMPRHVTEGSNEAASQLSGTTLGNKTKHAEARFSLVNDQYGAFGQVVAKGIDFPMSRHAPGVDGRGT